MRTHCTQPSNKFMMMSTNHDDVIKNEETFSRVTGLLLAREFTGPRWIPPHKGFSDVELWCFLWSTEVCLNRRLSKQSCNGWWFETLDSRSLWRHCQMDTDNSAWSVLLIFFGEKGPCERTAPSLATTLRWWALAMMTSWNGNIFCVTGLLRGEFTGPRWIPAQRPVTWSFDVFFDLCLNRRLSKQSCGWWFETLSRLLWRHCYGTQFSVCYNKISTSTSI